MSDSVQKLQSELLRYKDILLQQEEISARCTLLHKYIDTQTTPYAKKFAQEQVEKIC